MDPDASYGFACRCSLLRYFRMVPNHQHYRHGNQLLFQARGEILVFGLLIYNLIMKLISLKSDSS